MANTEKLVAGASIAAILTPLVLAGGFGWQAHRDASLRTAVDLQNAKLDTLADNVRSLQSAERLPLALVPHTCNASNHSAECMLTNTSSRAISTCFRGKLIKKKGDGDLKSLTACSGRMEPNSTKVVTALWSGGFARDICFSKNGWGHEVLDFDACAFDVESVSEAQPADVKPVGST